MKLIQCHFFFKSCLTLKFKVNFNIQLYPSLSSEDPVYLQVTFQYVYYLKYTERKSFFRHRVRVLKPV